MSVGWDGRISLTKRTTFHPEPAERNEPRGQTDRTGRPGFQVSLLSNEERRKYLTSLVVKDVDEDDADLPLSVFNAMTTDETLPCKSGSTLRGRSFSTSGHRSELLAF